MLSEPPQIHPTPTTVYSPAMGPLSPHTPPSPIASQVDTLSPTGRATERVTQNESEDRAYPVPPDAWTGAALANADYLDLGAVPVSPASAALVEAVAALVEASEDAREGRRYARGKPRQAKLRRAVAAVVGGVLRSWGRHGRAVYQLREPKAFSGGLVGHRQFIAVVDGLTAFGLLQASPAIRYGIEWGDSTSFLGKAARLRPAQPLLDLAMQHGVTPATVRADFGVEFSRKPPATPTALVVRRHLKEPRSKGQSRPERRGVIITGPDDKAAQRLSAGVLDANGWAAAHDVRGCLPPRWWRPFGPDWSLGGRWTALGVSGVYQRLSKEARRSITINGEATVEVDIQAAHLSIMHGLLGLGLPDGDPYAIAGLPRAVVKAWVTATLGKGSPVRHWAAGAMVGTPELAGMDAAAVRSAVVAKYPFLAAPAKAVAAAAGLDGLCHLGTPERLLTHRLMALEAAGLTAAMHFLRVDRAMLALPVHDSLIVPARAVRVTREALGLAFQAQTGAGVRTKLE